MGASVINSIMAASRRASASRETTSAPVSSRKGSATMFLRTRNLDPLRTVTRIDVRDGRDVARGLKAREEKRDGGIARGLEAATGEAAVLRGADDGAVGRA
jgi:hypothetical protein